MIPDWMRCINCKEPAKNGKIIHTKTCPDYQRPNLTTAKKVRLGDLLKR